MPTSTQEATESNPAARWMTTAAVVVWTSVLLVVALHAFLYPRIHTLFPFYAYGSHAFWQGHSLYHGSGLGDEFQYGPLFAIAVSPLAYLPEPLGNLLWKLLNVGAFLAALAIWLRHVLPGHLRTGDAALVFLLALGDSLQCVYDGNANLIVIAMILLAMAALATERNLPAAAWLAAATLAKAFPVTLAALLTVACGGAIAWPFAAAIGTGLALPIAIRPSAGISQTAAWFGVLLTRSNQRQTRHCSIDQLFRIFGHPLPIIWSNALAVGAGLAAMVLCFTYARRSGRRNALIFTLAAFCAWILLFLPSLEAATLAVAAPSVALALVDARRRGSYGWMCALAVAWWLLGLALTDVLGSRARVWIQDHGAIPIGGLLFAAYLVALWKKPAEAWKKLGVPSAMPSAAPTVRTQL